MVLLCFFNLSKAIGLCQFSQFMRSLPINVILLLGFFTWSCSHQTEKKANEQVQVPIPTLSKAAFAGTENCKSCHEKEYENWQGSHHQLAMQKADSSTVRANFNTTVTFNGVTSEFYTKGNNYYVKTADSDGQVKEFKINYTFGVTPLQQYIAEFPEGSYQCLQTAWDTEENKWFDLQPDLDIEPGEWLHWTGNAMKWNTACADCHSTNVHKNFEPESGVYETSFSAINVGCEACHGPGHEHVNFYEIENRGTPPELYMALGMNSKELVQKCARCHSRRTQLTSFFDYEGHYLDHYEPQLITAPTYEPDGQISDEDYVYASFVQSKMYANGVSCRDCHDMHSMELKAIGNTLCMQCHEPKYNSKEHHFHPMDTESAECVNCHMTGKTYMGNDFRRDHSFRIPRPDQSMQYGTPNACNGCHQDKSADWAARKVEKWYGSDRKDHFSNHLLKGFAGDKAELFYLLEHQDYPDIVRASAVSYLTSMVSANEVQQIKKYLSDQSALVRNETVKLIGSQQPENGSDLLESVINDPVRMIRINSAEFMSRWQALDESNPDHVNALAEYTTMLEINADFPSGQQRIAEHAQSKGETQKAIAAYRKALEIDNYSNTARMNLALLLYQNGNAQEAETLYLKVTQQEPEVSYPYFMLGLLYNEQNQPELAASHLARACDREPFLERAFYNYAIMLQQREAYSESLNIIRKGLNRGGQNQPDLLYMKLLAEMNLEDWQNAKTTASTLVVLSGQNPRFVQILEQLKRENPDR